MIEWKTNINKIKSNAEKAKIEALRKIAEGLDNINYNIQH